MAHRILIFFTAFILAACANNDFSRVAPASKSMGAYHLADVSVDFAPDAVLEWCEDNLLQCDMVELRIAQTFQAGAMAGATGFRGERPARLEVTVDRFDSITLAARYTTGGVHDIDASYRLIDIATGEVIASRDALDFDRIAWGRAAGIIANLNGRTQRVRIAERIAQVTGEWLRAVSGQSI